MPRQVRTSARTAAARPRVALVCMPFASARYPSIQLGLLQAILTRHAIPATTYYFNLHYAARIGWEVFELFCRSANRLLGDWLFARAAFRDCAPDASLYLEAQHGELEQFTERFGRTPEYLRRLREEDAPAFLRECLESVPWDQYDVVGFSSIFAQNTAALALARLLKERYPRLVTVFGGANFEDEMGVEYVRALPWIDYAVIGEGDVSFPALLERIGAGEEVLDLPGVAHRRDGRVAFGGQSPPVDDLDPLPEPDYAAYFATAAALDLPAEVLRQRVQLPYESARGCWWGAKHHCTFCGLNGNGMAYRSKSPARVLTGFEEQSGRYGVRDFMAVDNILDMRYLRDVFGVLAGRPPTYTFFHEVKANLSRAHVETLARAGVTSIQPGIESLSTRLLQLMRKGVTGIQNVCLLKWAHYHGIDVAWNLLAGFPGERAEDYERQLSILRLIPHLQPAFIGVVEVHRFSPYFTDAASLGVHNVRPNPGYAQIYPPTVDLDRIAYFFDFDAPEKLPLDVHTPWYEHVLWWRRVWGRPGGPFLTYRCDEGSISITDGRRCDSEPRVHRLHGQAALIYQFCDSTHHGARQILEHLQSLGITTDRSTVQTHLDRFTTLGLMLEEDNHYLSLALPEQPDRRQIAPRSQH